jgi:hypothetical protein
MPTAELESDVKRVIVGALPASVTPSSTTVEPLSWDHRRFPGIFWRKPDPFIPDILTKEMRLLGGVKIGESEKAMVVVEGRPYAIIPSGDWLQDDIGVKGGDGGMRGMELIWVDMRQFEASCHISGVRTAGGRTIDVECDLRFRVTDANALVRNLVMEYDVKSKDLDPMIQIMFEKAVISEVGKRATLDLPTKTSRAVMAVLMGQMGGWGMEPVAVRLSEAPPWARGKAPPIAREPAPSSDVSRSQLHEFLLKTRKKAVVDMAAPDLEWDAAPKRWVPKSRKGEVKCDGCGDNDGDLYALCEVTCRSSTKCRLCRECLPKRKMCAFTSINVRTSELWMKEMLEKSAP